MHVNLYRLPEKNLGVIDFFRKHEFVPYSQQILDTGLTISNYSIYPASSGQYLVSVNYC